MILRVDKTSWEGNSNIEIAPNSLVWKGSDAVANKVLPSPHVTARTALFINIVAYELLIFDALVYATLTMVMDIFNNISTFSGLKHTLYEAF